MKQVKHNYKIVQKHWCIFLIFTDYFPNFYFTFYEIFKKNLKALPLILFS